jgi:DNA-binding LacI/PurR family transcriptional regulator
MKLEIYFFTWLCNRLHYRVNEINKQILFFLPIYAIVCINDNAINWRIIMGVTIKDIAKIAGVSPSTVSRVLNGNNVISKETSDRIQLVMAEMDYHPDSRARNLITGNTNSIGLIMDAKNEFAFFNTFFDRSVYAIEKVIQDKGYTLLIANDDSMAEESLVEKLVFEKKIDGLLLPASIVHQKLVEMLKKNKFPFVILGEPDNLKVETCWVDIDNKEGGRMAVTHMLEHGYKNIALLVGDRKNVFVRNRICGYLNGLTQSTRQIDDSLVQEGVTPETAEAVTHALLVKENRPDAFLCSDNVIAWHVLQAIKHEGLNVPNDIGIITFDNYPIAQYTEPPLTAVDVDTYGMGEKAAIQLLQIMNKVKIKNQHLLMKPVIVARDSSSRKE